MLERPAQLASWSGPGAINLSDSVQSGFNEQIDHSGRRWRQVCLPSRPWQPLWATDLAALTPQCMFSFFPELLSVPGPLKIGDLAVCVLSARLSLRQPQFLFAAFFCFAGLRISKS